MLYLVIDIGGTYMKYGYYQENGEIQRKGKIPTIKTNIEEFYEMILSLVEKNIDGIALSMPGLIDSQPG